MCVCNHCPSNNSRRTWHINSKLGMGVGLGRRSLLLLEPSGQISTSLFLKQRNVVQAISSERIGITPRLLCGFVLEPSEAYVVDHLGQMSRNELACCALVFTKHNFT